jgi:hypothetical protein
LHKSAHKDIADADSELIVLGGPGKKKLKAGQLKRDSPVIT